MNLRLGSFLREQRHVFGICPDCGEISRLSDIQISYKTKYISDWLDTIEEKKEFWNDRIDQFEQNRRAMHDKAIERARSVLLPKKLKSVFPPFLAERLHPKDVKVILHPLNFIGFDGLNDGNVRRILLLDSKDNSIFRGKFQRYISRVIEDDRYDWSVLRVDESGKLTEE